MASRLVTACAVRWAGRRALHSHVHALSVSSPQLLLVSRRSSSTSSAGAVQPNQQLLLKQMLDFARAGKETEVVSKLEQLRELQGPSAVLENPAVGKALGLLIRRVVATQRDTAIRRTLLALMEKDLLPLSNATDALRVAVSHTPMVLKVFDWLHRKGQTPLFQQYMIAANAFLDKNKLNEVLVLVVDMLRCGVPPPVVLFEAVLSACAKSKQAQVAVQVLELMELARGRPPPSRAFESALDACVGAGDFEEALKLCKRTTELRMPYFDVAASCHVELGQVDEAMACLSRAYEMGVELSDATYARVLKAVMATSNARDSLRTLIQQAMRVANTPSAQAIQLLLLLSGIEHAAHCSEIIRELQRLGYQPTAEHYCAMFGLHVPDPSLEVQYMEKLLNEEKFVDTIHLTASMVAAAPEIVEFLPRYVQAALREPRFQNKRGSLDSVVNLCVQALTRADVAEGVVEAQLAQLEGLLDPSTHAQVKLAVAIHRLPCSEALRRLREAMPAVTSLHLNQILSAARAVGDVDEQDKRDMLKFFLEMTRAGSGEQALDAPAVLKAAELCAELGEYDTLKRLIDQASSSGLCTKALLRVGVEAARKASNSEDLASFAKQMVDSYSVSPEALDAIQHELLERWSYAHALGFAGTMIDRGQPINTERISTAIAGLHHRHAYAPVVQFWQRYQEQLQAYVNSDTFALVLSSHWKASHGSGAKAVIDMLEQFYGTPSVVASTPGLTAWKVYITAVRKVTKQPAAILGRLQRVLQQMVRSRKLDWPEVMDVEAARGLHECKLVDLASQLLEAAPATTSSAARNKFYRHSPIDSLKLRVSHLRAMQRPELAVSLLARELESVKDWQANKLQKLSNELRWAVSFGESSGQSQEAERLSALLRVAESKRSKSEE